MNLSTFIFGIVFNNYMIIKELNTNYKIDIKTNFIIL